MRFTRRSFAAASLAGPAAATTLLRTAAHQATSTPMASPDASADMQASLEKALAESGAPGAIVLIDHPEHGVQKWAVGKANVKTGEPMATDMHMRIGSITKTFVSTVMLQLAAEGKFGLDDTLGSLTDAFRDLPYADEMTIRQILSMRAGLNDFLTSPGYLNATMADWSRPYTNEELLGYALEVDPIGKPGEKFAYSNTGYLVLGMLAEELTGSPYQDLITTRIIDELKLSGTSIPDSADMPSPAPTGYMSFAADQTLDPAASPAATASAMPSPVATPIAMWESHGDETGPYDITALHPSAVSAAGSMVSTLDDINAWLIVLSDGSLLPEELHKEQLTGDSIGSDTRAEYGLGVILGPGGMVGHNGGVPGFQSNALALTEQDLRIVVFTNAFPGEKGPDSTEPLISALIGQ